MNRKLNFIALCFASVLLFACNEGEKLDGQPSKTQFEIDQVEGNLPVKDNSRISLDWAGVYKGVLPCADCEGIETTLVIHEDGSYKLTSEYITQLEELGETTFIDEGMINWDGEGSIIALLSTLRADDIGHYKVGENKLFVLDANKKQIEGALADNYILIKVQ